MKRRHFLRTVPLALGALHTPRLTHSAELPAATAAKLPHWRGFNLLEKFMRDGAGPYHEADFQTIADWGFNFVRLPMDYRIWTARDDWRTITDGALKEIDQAVEWGGKHGVHVCLNFHRAPGYTVAKPEESASLWKEAEAREVCALHWGAFAKRYAGVPSARLSFNLLNEPPKLDPKTYRDVVKQLTEAIHAQDAERLVIADGRDWGGTACDELRDLGVAQAMRGYAPIEISHYEANWMTDPRLRGANKPYWPMPLFHGFVFGPDHKDRPGTLTFTGPIEQGTVLRLKVEKVSGEAQLKVKADGKEVFSRAFKPGPDDSDCKESKYEEQWKIYQGRYDHDYRATLPQAQMAEVLLVGDWLSLSEVGLTAPGQPASSEISMLATAAWEKPPQHFEYAPADPGSPLRTADCRDAASLRRTWLQQWVDLKSRGVGVFAGEWGAYNHTPHAVTLKWMEDVLALWKENEIGWALWNLKGGFGILDSGRRDVAYEDWHGHKLDRKMLELLQRY